MKVLLVALVAIVAITAANPTAVTSADAVVKIQDGHFDIIVDIRSSSEYAEGHIEGAINMPLMTALERLQGCEGHKIAVHCYHGYDRARPFSYRMARANFTQVFDIGGFKNLAAHVATGEGLWNGALPSCSHEHHQNASYIESQVMLQGVSDLSASEQSAFKTVVAQNVGSICGADAAQACDAASDIHITSVTPAARRSGTVTVGWWIKVDIAASASGISAVATLVSSGSLATQLRAEGGSLSQVSSAALVAAPSATSHEELTAPSNPRPSQQRPATLSPITANEFGVYDVESEQVTQRVAAGDFDIIVDVRSQREYEQGHISGALHLRGNSAVDVLQGCEAKTIGVYCWTGWDRATPTAQRMAAAGFTNVYDLGGLQFMDGMTVETGMWDGELPTCAAGPSAEEEASMLCLVFFGLLGLLALLLVLVVVICAAYACRPQAVATSIQASGAVAVVVASNPLDIAVDIEKAKAQQHFQAAAPPYTASSSCGGARACAPGVFPAAGVPTMAVAASTPPAYTEAPPKDQP